MGRKKPVYSGLFRIFRFIPEWNIPVYSGPEYLPPPLAKRAIDEITPLFALPLRIRRGSGVARRTAVKGKQSKENLPFVNQRESAWPEKIRC
jgi:hypothetical protein